MSASHFAILAKCPTEVIIELEQYLLDCNYPKLERIAHRQYKQKNISYVIERFFMAESEFQSRYLLSAFEPPINAMDLPRFSPHTLDKAIHECYKALGSVDGSSPSSERLFLRCMLGKLLVFVGRYEEALKEAFDHFDPEEISCLFKTDYTSSEERLDAAAGSLPHFVAIQASFCWGAAREMTGRAVEALLPYSHVTDFARRLPSGHHLMRSKAMIFFTGMAMFRYGMLCSVLAIDPRPMLRVMKIGARPTSRHSSSSLGYKDQEPGTVSQLRSKLLFDAAISLRMFISFQPNTFGNIRHSAALEAYLEALEARFRKSNYQSAFEVDQQFYGLIGAASTGGGGANLSLDLLHIPLPPPDGEGGITGSSALSTSSATVSSGPFAPENVEEDLLLGLAVLHTLFPPPIAFSSLAASTMPVECSNGENPIGMTDLMVDKVQRGAALPINLLSLARFARLGDAEGLVMFVKTLLTRYAGEASVYGRLVLSCAAAPRTIEGARHDEVLRSGEIYYSLGGREAAVIAVWATRCLLFPKWSFQVISHLESILDTGSQGDMLRIQDNERDDEPQQNTLRILLGLALIKSSLYTINDSSTTQEFLERAITVLAQAVIYDETDPRPHLSLSLGYALQGKLRAAEDSVKTALSLEPEQPAAWYLFALLASARRDFDLCWKICNLFGAEEDKPEGVTTEDRTLLSSYGLIPMALLKTQLLVYWGMMEEAIKVVSGLITSFTHPAGLVVEEKSSLSALQLDGKEEKASLDPAQFRSRFYPAHEQSINSIKISQVGMSPAQKNNLTISEYKSHFPDPVARTAVARLRGKSNELLFPESTLSSHEYLAMLESESVILGPNPAFSLLTTQLWCALGRIYLVQEQVSFAELCAHEALLVSELDSDTYCLKGEILEQQGNRVAAIDAYGLALQMNCQQTNAHLGLARCYYYDNPSDSAACQLALQSAWQAIDTDPNHVSALSFAADLARHAGMDKEAATLYQRALQLEAVEPLCSWRTAVDFVIYSLIR